MEQYILCGCKVSIDHVLPIVKLEIDNELIKFNWGNYILHHTTLPSLWKTLPYSMCTVVIQWMGLSVKDGKRFGGKVKYNGAKV